MKKQTTKQLEQLMADIEEALLLRFDVRKCSYVQFRQGFPISRTYETTVCVNDRIFITYDIAVDEIQIYDTDEDINGDWYNWINFKEYSEIEIGIYLYIELSNKIF